MENESGKQTRNHCLAALYAVFYRLQFWRRAYAINRASSAKSGRRAAVLPRLATKSSDLLTIDALRFIAAAGVMFFHSAHYFELWPGYDSSLFDPLRLLVDLFFAISGFVIGYSYFDRVSTGEGVRKFLKGRFAYIYPLHFATFIVSLGIGLVGAGQTGHAQNYDPRCIPANLVLGQAWGMCSHLSFNGPSWSLSAEAMMYLLFPLFAFMGHRRPSFILSAAVISFALLTGTSIFSDHPWHEWMTPNGALRAVPSFLFGLSLWLYRDRLRRLPGCHVLLYGAIAIVAALIWKRAPGLMVLVGIYGIVLFSCACDVQRRRTVVASSLAPFGSLTMEIYMLHQLTFIVVLTVIAKRLLELHGLAMNVAILGSYALVFGMAYVAKYTFVDPVKKAILSRGASLTAPIRLSESPARTEQL